MCPCPSLLALYARHSQHVIEKQFSLFLRKLAKESPRRVLLSVGFFLCECPHKLLCVHFFCGRTHKTVSCPTQRRARTTSSAGSIGSWRRRRSRIRRRTRTCVRLRRVLRTGVVILFFFCEFTQKKRNEMGCGICCSRKRFLRMSA